MRFRASRLFGVPILSLLLGLQLASCAGSQQDQEMLEVENQDGQYAEQGEYGDQEYNYGQQEESDYNYAEEGSNYGDVGEYGDEEFAGEGYNYAGTESNYAGTETEDGLQDIIEEMNGEGEFVAEEGYDAGSQELVDAGAGYDASMTPSTDPMAMDAAAGMTAPVAASDVPNMPFQPGGAPAGDALPEMGSKMPYFVQPGDTLAKISQKIYGDMGRWQEMASLSGLSNPSRIYPGDVVYYTLEDASIPFATAYEQVQRSEEQVQAGDTLASISQRIYGTSNGWKSIWRQNDNIENPDVVNPGTIVYYVSSTQLAQEVAKQRVLFAQMKQDTQIKSVEMAQASEAVEASNGILLADGHVDMDTFDFI